MKALKKNVKFFVLSAMVLIASSLFVAGCINLIADEEEQSHTLPAGMGAVRLSFGNTSARTILPDMLTIGDFKSFLVVFTDEHDVRIPYFIGTGDIPDELLAKYPEYNDDNVPDPKGHFGLLIGDYRLTVQAYSDDSFTIPIARAGAGKGVISTVEIGGEPAADFHVDDIETLTVYVLLEAERGVDTETKFLWDITNEIDDDFKATITLTDWADRDNVYGPYTITQDTSTHKGDFFPGQDMYGRYYIVNMEVKKGLGIYEFRDIAHIYKNMTTTFKYTLTDEMINYPAGGIIIFIEVETLEGIKLEYSVASDKDTGDGLTPDTAIILSRNPNGVYPTEVTLSLKTEIDYERDGYTWWHGGNELAHNKDLVLKVNEGIFAGNQNATYTLTLIGSPMEHLGGSLTIFSQPFFVKVVD